jgi:hypothetical protein
MNFATRGEGALRRAPDDARERSPCTREALTVLQVDRSRLDTPANHRDGAWVAEQLEPSIGSHRRVHWRGLHYAIVAAGNAVKPNCTPAVDEKHSTQAPLISSSWSWVMATRALKARKAYGDES